MATTQSSGRGTWNSKLGFILAAAGSAVGLGNIWRFPTEMAENGGAAFLILYAALVFIIGYPVMVGELSLGRKTQRNPVGAFRAISDSKFFPIVGFWGVLCGIAILSFYVIVAGWTLGYFFEQIFYSVGWYEWANWIKDTDNGWLNAGVAIVFMMATVGIILGGVSDGIERAVKYLMPLLVVILLIMIVYVMFQPGSAEGLRRYLIPDFSAINSNLMLAAMGQAFFSLSLGMGALITYGSYLNRKENIPEVAGYVTVADLGIAFMAGLLIMPAIFMAQSNGLEVFNPQDGSLLAGPALIFQILPELFHNMGGAIGLIFGASFFFLLSIAALTSSISLLEVPTAYLIDEHGMKRKFAAILIGSGVLVISVIIAFDTSLIGNIDFIFSKIGLPLGGLMLCVFLGYFWKMENVKLELEKGYEGIHTSKFFPIWSIFIRYICPILIGIVLVTTLLNFFR